MKEHRRTKIQVYKVGRFPGRKSILVQITSLLRTEGYQYSPKTPYKLRKKTKQTAITVPHSPNQSLSRTSPFKHHVRQRRWLLQIPLQISIYRNLSQLGLRSQLGLSGLLCKYIFRLCSARLLTHTGIRPGLVGCAMWRYEQGRADFGVEFEDGLDVRDPAWIWYHVVVGGG